MLTTSHATNDVQRAARRAADSEWTDRLARLGFCARGLVYLIVGVLALQIAWASSSDEASKDGALREISQRSFGKPLLLVLAVGLAGYALWRLTEALWGKQDEDDEKKRTLKRIGSGAKAALYAALCLSTIRVLIAGPSSTSGGDAKEESITARVLGWPGGRLVVGAVGVAIIVGGAYVAYRGLAKKFEKRLDTSDMSPGVGRTVDVLGMVGLAARGLVFAVAGFLLVKAALDFDPKEATGLDGTLRTIASQAYGQLMLTVTAIGIMAFGLYSFVEARYRQL